MCPPFVLALAGKKAVDVNGQKSTLNGLVAANFTKFSFLFEKTSGKSAPAYLGAVLKIHFLC